jgi:hypothetical protein
MTQSRVETIELQRDTDYEATVEFDQPVSAFAEMRFTVREDWAMGDQDNDGAVYTTLLTATGTYTAMLTIPSATVRSLLRKRYVHDIKVITTTGKRHQTQLGPVFVGPDVTR